MAHYFDDTFSRHISQPKDSKPSLRRSSTRSIGARSDFDTSVNGDEEDDKHSVGNSAPGEDPEQKRLREEADVHVANYVSEQLQKVRSHESAVEEDEFEAQLDEE